MFVTPAPDPNVENLPQGETGVLEAYVRGISKAEDFIYIEDQYFNSPEIAAAIQVRMLERPLLEVILVLNSRPDIGGYHAHQTSLINQLYDSLGGSRNRLGVFTMWSTDATQQRFEVTHVYMHSKVAIVDDRWAAVGTANVDGASMNQRQWKVILPGLLEIVGDLDDLPLAMVILWFPIIFLVVLITSPVLLLLPDIGPFLVGVIKKEFARASEYANPNREHQPARHCEIDFVLYNGVAGQPSTSKITELRESLWSEMLGAPPPSTKPSIGWVGHWQMSADNFRNTIKNASDDVPTVVPSKTKILEWVAERNYEAYLRSFNIKTKNLRVRDSGVSMPFQMV